MKASLTSCAALALIAAVSLGACTKRDESTLAPAASSSNSSTTTPAPISDTSTSSSNTGGTTSQEVQRGASGVDVDVGKDAQKRGGLPGVDVDVGADARRNRASGVVVDTRASGAGAEKNVAERRRLRADRN